jgi:serine/threonine protein phosphatase PrpC
LTKEHTLYSGEERRRPVPRGCLLEHLEGDDSIKWKVRVDVAMPEGKAKAVAYEPTRGIGHTIGQYHGISPCPSLSVCEVEALDIIVVASDGLWNALGRCWASSTAPS